MNNIKQLLIATFAFVSLLNNAQAVTIFEIQDDVALYATTVTGSSGLFYDQDFSGPADFVNPIDATTLKNNVIGSDLTRYAWTPDAHIPNGPDNAYIDLSFGQDIYNRDGNDLVLFFAGTGTMFQDGHTEGFKFSIDINADNIFEGGLMSVFASETSDIYNGDFFAAYAFIDLDDFGFNQQSPLGDIRIYLGDSSLPSLAALGAYNTSAMAVPLPLSSVLFASGLALIGLIRRKA